MSEQATRFAATYSLAAAVAAAVLAPLLALAYFATAEGAEQLTVGSVSAWADPARDALAGALEWASADRVYSTYLQGMALAFPAVLLTALAVRARRLEAPEPMSRGERRGWRVALVGYAIAGAGLIAVALMLIPGDPASGGVDAAFLALLFPGMLVGVIGSTMLGISLLRGGFAPASAAWLLALSVPMFLIGGVVLGHNSLGMLSLFVAWALAGRSLVREPVGRR